MITDNTELTIGMQLSAATKEYVRIYELIGIVQSRFGGYYVIIPVVVSTKVTRGTVVYQTTKPRVLRRPELLRDFSTYDGKRKVLQEAVTEEGYSTTLSTPGSQVYSA